MSDTAASHYLDELNEVQRNAVTTTDGPVLVVAGPGSGKTRVLTYRIAYILEQGTPPWQVLALTFTNKAAREMKSRIEKVVGEPANRLWAGTFHSLFARILRVEADKIGYPSNFTIYDTDDTKSLISNIIKEMNLNKETYKVNSVRSRISSAKSNLITPKLYADQQELIQQDRQANMPLVYKIYEKYTARCKKAGAMDFDDLLYRLYELLQSDPETLKKYRERFKYVLVDEFQDTNHLQYAIIRKLVQYEDSPRNICVVGDDAQSIYAFRGATIQNILDFEQDFQKFGIQVFKLEQNYRSTEHIVQAANEVIRYNRRQIQKKIWSDKGQGQKIKVIRAIDDGEEGKRVVDTIVEHKNRYHIHNKDIAILYRTNSQSRTFEEFLRRYNIPYKVFGGQSFYQRKEVKDLIAYLRLVVNPADEEALRRVINYPRRGIGDTTVARVTEAAGLTNKSLFEAFKVAKVAGRTRNSIDGFIAMIEEAAKTAVEGNAYEVAVQVARGSGLQDHLNNDKTIEGINRLENLNALLDGIKAFVEEDTVIDTETLPDKSLATYLQNIALLTDFDQGETDGNHVTLMSVHAAKGLEYKSVFVVGLEEKLFPSFMSMETIEGLDEERRLFYVAITRAEAHLTLSYANSRYRFGKITYNQPSRFLDEIPEVHLDLPAATNKRRPESSWYEQKPSGKPSTAKVSGSFKSRQAAPSFRIDPKDFRPNHPSEIQEGQEVLHLKFGKGKVQNIDGRADNRVATIVFPDLGSNSEKRIMLKFAKLQIL